MRVVDPTVGCSIYDTANKLHDSKSQAKNIGFGITPIIENWLISLVCIISKGLVSIYSPRRIAMRIVSEGV